VLENIIYKMRSSFGFDYNLRRYIMGFDASIDAGSPVELHVEAGGYRFQALTSSTSSLTRTYAHSP